MTSCPTTDPTISRSVVARSVPPEPVLALADARRITPVPADAVRAVLDRPPADKAASAFDGLLFAAAVARGISP
ncbi:hypothetical protein CLV34_0502 [Luteimicrobium subarcticum]|uniref:Uncharacterized protein n=2 Tax=Luteimicrobium subarcticum TaxID=620910 RepID=A0A2M8WUP0_9MICO|nr:hypothetical protein CLV34_0502 [Luteimicrobium subarcticum]